METKKIYEHQSGITSVPYCPRNTLVLIKAYYEVSPLMVGDEKALNNMKPIKQEVVGYGRNVEDINIGDNVTINPKNASQVSFKWNEKSIMRYMENQKASNTLYTGSARVVCEEYFIVDQMDVLGIDLYIEKSNTKILEN